MRLIEPEHLEEDCPITTISEKKDSQLFRQAGLSWIFMGFENCLLKGQDSSNGFKDCNGCLVKPWILLVGNTCTKMVILNKLVVVVVVVVGPFAKNLDNVMFSDIVGIRQSSSKCPGWRSRSVIHSWTPRSSLPPWPSWALLESWFSWAPWDHFHCGDCGHLSHLGNHGH